MPKLNKAIIKHPNSQQLATTTGSEDLISVLAVLGFAIGESVNAYKIVLNPDLKNLKALGVA